VKQWRIPASRQMSALSCIVVDLLDNDISSEQRIQSDLGLS
jgi:hypothetical protein